MNVQHSMRNDDWRTPDYILDRVRGVLGPIDLDPASSAEANKVVQAGTYLTKEEDGLNNPWPKARSVYLNPPGGKLGRRGLASLWWEKLMDEWMLGNFNHAIFAGFSIDLLQSCQLYGGGPYPTDFTLCVPMRRVQWVDPLGTGRSAPSHSNVFIYVPAASDNTEGFEREFGELGAILKGRIV